MEWRHPKYYAELRKLRKKEQASKPASSKPTSSQAQADKRSSHKPEAASSDLPSQEK
tara:strand:- start:545 stop:715 length:171 start_codon:yes stop_codon:yes gene_type:complete